jgi:HAD domain in Swiss Army Knife RNA repair proteins
MKYIFIDVDGVLNTDYVAPGGLTVLAKPGNAGPFKLNLNPEHGKWLLKLAENTDSSLVWGSTWKEHANEWVGSHIGLPDIPHLTFPSYDSPERAKATAAMDLAGDSRFVYFDDWFNISSYIHDCNGHHIWVDPHHGLKKEHIEEAERFLNTD